jgi:hypothetical protein
VLALIVLIVVVACATAFAFKKKAPEAAPVTPTIPAQPTPSFVADFSSPSIGIKGYINGAVPPVVYQSEPGSKWYTFEGPEGSRVIDPLPADALYKTLDNVLYLDSIAGSTGWPMVSDQMFDKTKTVRIEAIMSCTLLNDNGWGGLVLYNGEDDYKAWYFSRDLQGDPNYLTVDVWSTTKRVDTGLRVPANTPAYMSITYYPDGRWEFGLNTTKFAMDNNSVLPDTTTLKNDPRAAIFLGDMRLTVKDFKVFEIQSL